MEIKVKIEDRYWTVLWSLLKKESYIQDVEIIKNGTAEHPLAKFIGCMEGEDGNEIARILSTEFQQIEGEW